MILIVNNQKIDLDFSTSEEMITYISSFQNQELMIENLYINQQSINGDLIQYIINNFEEIEKLEINYTSKDKFTKEVVTSLNGYLRNAIPQIEKLSESFYLSPSNDEWKKLYDLLEGLHYITTAVHTFSTEQTNGLEITSSEKDELFRTIQELSRGIEQKDSVLIADVLIYEIKNQFEKLQVKLQNFLIVEAKKNEAN